MSNKKVVNFFCAFLSLALRLSLELDIESDCQFLAFIKNNSNLGNLKCVLKLLTAKSVLPSKV